MFIYKLSGCRFESRCSHLNFRYCNCFEQGVPWHSGNYRVWIHSKKRTWHDKNIQSPHSLTILMLLFVKLYLLLVSNKLTKTLPSSRVNIAASSICTWNPSNGCLNGSADVVQMKWKGNCGLVLLGPNIDETDDCLSVQKREKGMSSKLNFHALSL